MYASIRQYKSSDPAEAGRRAKEDFIPIVTEIAGVSAWYIVDGGDGSLTTITLADDQAGVEESVSKAREWVAANVADLIQGEPTVTNGEVMAHS
jgi:hypothetical protein